MQRTLYSTTPLIRSPMGQNNFAILTGDHINKGFFTRKCMATLPYGPKKVAIITRWQGCKAGFHCICTINDDQEFSLYFLTLLGATFKLVRPDDTQLIILKIRSKTSWFYTMHLPGEKWVWNPCQGLLWCWKPANNNNNNNHIILRCTSTKVKVAWVASNTLAWVAGVIGEGEEEGGIGARKSRLLIWSSNQGCQK